jgi:hypothetical protein
MQETIMEEAMGSPPSMGTPVGTPGAGNNSRRPPRKSTLTQQQKNQKRQRATQDQLITLEREFNKNPTPTAMIREKIADEISMTERSVQIWFQNRYVVSCTIAIFAANAQVGEPRSRISPRRASKMEKIAMRYQSPCAAISRYRPWSLVSHWHLVSLDAEELSHMAAACCSTQIPARAKLVSVSINQDLTHVC